ncbi:MAG TPA: helix-turn-helix transcriptional regulator [Pseudonocardiaceae bacterium]|jgi:transcriptional regulator with XRE-family HTH domain|nr:helix-turn-helix transcriptional regulator [Pseudonocardiaceae bacterium]
MAEVTPGTVTSIRKQVGNLVRRVRDRERLTQTELGKMIGLSQSTVTNIESGRTRIKPAHLELLISCCHVADDTARELRDLVNDDQQGKMRGGQRALRTRGGPLELVPSHFREFTELEPTASKIRGWHGERIPGLLQSEHYMLNQFKFYNRSGDTVPQLILGRKERKKVFTQHSPPLIQFLLGAGSLRRVPGGPNPLIMQDQLEHLIWLMDEYRLLSIHLVPFDAKLAYVPNDFTIMEFRDGTTNFVYVEYPGGGQHLEDWEIYKESDQQWDELRGVALERQETYAEFVKLAKAFGAR